MGDLSPLAASPDFGHAASFKDLEREGYVPFALGPIYAYAEVQASLPDCFAADADAPKKSEPVRGMDLQLEAPVLVRCDRWNFMLSIMDRDNYPVFDRWLMSQHFVDRAKRKFFVVRRYAVPVLDPVSLALGKREPAKLTVYTVSGVRGLLKPVMAQSGEAAEYVGVDGKWKHPDDITPKDEVEKRVAGDVPKFVNFTVAPPEEDVITLARAALEIVDNA